MTAPFVISLKTIRMTLVSAIFR